MDPEITIIQLIPDKYYTVNFLVVNGIGAGKAMGWGIRTPIGGFYHNFLAMHFYSFISILKYEFITFKFMLWSLVCNLDLATTLTQYLHP